MKKEITVIIVDDEKLARLGMIAFFKNTNINVIGQAQNDKELFNLLKFEKPNIILLDLEFPVLNGSKSMNKLRKQYPEINVIILAKYHDEQLISDMFKRGARAFISKANADSKTITNALNKVSKHGFYLDNIACLLMEPGVKDRHYYRAILTPKEIKIMGLLNNGKSNEEICNELHITKDSLKYYIATVFKKLGVRNRTEFGIFATKYFTLPFIQKTQCT
jgi:DNA-binding NarL/FixJ family response regulator